MKALYRIIAAVAALLAFPALFFIKLIQITVDLGFVEGYFHDSFAVYDFFDFIKDKNIDFDKDFTIPANLAETLAPLKARAITALVFLCLMIVAILAVFICSAFTNARKTNLCLSVFGAVSVVGLMISFNSMTSLVVDGTVGLDAIINALLADTGTVLGSLASGFGLGGLVGVIGELKALQLTSATMAVLFLFIFIAIWTAAFILIDLDEYKAPKVKKQTKKKRK